MDARELEGKRFRCLEGCGFCCTFQPEVSQRELALLRARFKPKPLAIAVGEGRTYLQLQNKCGACTLLAARNCTAYDLRPAHCRYFPFHVHFGDATEVYVNATCRGVEAAPAGVHLEAEFKAGVLDVAPPDEWKEHERAAIETYSEFQRRARRKGAWGDAHATLAEALAAGPDVFTAAWLEAATAKGGEPAPREEILSDALAPFHEDEVTKRPFYLAPDLRWLTFEPAPDAPPGHLRVLVMDEAGRLLPAGDARGLHAWEDLPPEIARPLFGYLARLTARRLFVGSVYALVDDGGYETTVPQATWLRVAEIAADLVVRARVLLAMGTPPEAVPDEVVRFYDSTFLDSPTIGGFL